MKVGQVMSCYKPQNHIKRTRPYIAPLAPPKVSIPEHIVNSLDKKIDPFHIHIIVAIWLYFMIQLFR